MSKKSKAFWAGVALALLAAGAAYAAGGSGHISLSQRVNAWFDDLEAVNGRVLDLPIWMLASLTVLVAAIGVIAAERLAFGKAVWKRSVIAIFVLAVALGLAVHADHRIESLQSQINDLRGQLATARLASMDPPPQNPADPPKAAAPVAVTPVAKVDPPSIPVAKPVEAAPARRTTYLFDRDRSQKSLSSLFGTVDMRPILYDQATDLVQVKLNNGPAVAYLTIIDLTVPGVQVKVGGSLAAKTFTSDFAKNNGCTIAINGEAGVSPMANSGLGTWRGNLLEAGKILLQEAAGNPRPFLSFDQAGAGTFIPMAASTRAVPKNGFNVIWGRLDALIDGNVQTDPERNRQPRTAMGISKDGTKLYLMVVDGRQQRFSIGFTRAEVGEFLMAFGAYNGMLCDEGGSSCMYTKVWGIINSPSDGQERETYTHFGVVTPALPAQ